jgi:hypothetical protein
MNDIKEESNKGAEILQKKSNWDSGNEKLNKSKKIENLSSRLDQIEDNKMDVLKHSNEDKGEKKTKDTWIEHSRPGTPLKDQTYESWS